MALLLSSPHSASQDDVDDDEATGGATANGGTDLRDFEDAKSMAERLAVERVLEAADYFEVHMYMAHSICNQPQAMCAQ